MIRINSVPSASAQGGVKQATQRVLTTLLLVGCVIAVACGAYFLHTNLSTAGSAEMLLVLLVALRFGFIQATLVSLSVIFCLNFLFIPPIFTFTVADPQNWVSLFTFETTALLVSILSSKVRSHAAQVEAQRGRAIKLYELSRAILLIDRRQPAAAQLQTLIAEIFMIDQVEVLISPEPFLSVAYEHADEDVPVADGGPTTSRDDDDPLLGTSNRLLRQGETTIGSISMKGWKVDPLTADAVASLAAITYERAQALRREDRAEIQRDAERLRSVVLDGLAHGFKTPLTAIQTASSGLLAIDHLNPAQAQLVLIIDERATMLNHMTTRLLQTAALEAKEIRLRRKSDSMADVLYTLVHNQDEETRNRTTISVPEDPHEDQLDRPLIELAIQQLIDNAARYSAVGSLIEITMIQTISETTVIVQNTSMPGYSIKPEERTRIFDRFYRGVDVASRPAGTGLGLSIVKKTAEAHGGHVAVDCLDDRTRFTFAIQYYSKGKHE